MTTEEPLRFPGEFRYGVNPHERASYTHLPALKLTPSASLSWNAYLDIWVAHQSCRSATPNLVYVKHALPQFCLQLTADPQSRRRLRTILAFHKRRNFGAFFYSGHLTLEVLHAIEGFGFHTMCAASADDAAIDIFRDAEFQRRNRGAILALGDIPHAAKQEVVVQNNAHSVSYDRTFPVEGTFAAHVSRTIRLLRTVAVAVYDEKDLILTNSGFVSGMECLDYTLGQLRSFADKPLTVATDACFGLQDPRPYLTGGMFREVYLYGDKSEHAAIAADLRLAGIAVHHEAARAFSYGA